MKNLSFYLLLFTLSSSGIFLSFVLMPHSQVNEDEVFDKFIQQFTSASLPYEITIEEGVVKRQMITGEFGDFVPELMRAAYSRMPPKRYFFKDKIYENEEMIVVTYGILPARSMGEGKPIEYVLATYKKGKNIDGQRRLITTQTVASTFFRYSKSQISKDLVIITQTLMDPNNKEEAASEEQYKISADGKIKSLMTIEIDPFKQQKIEVIKAF